MLIKDLMSKQMNYLPPKASLQDACQKMLTGCFGFLPIEENGKLVGVVTDRDVAIRGVAKGLGPYTPIEQVITKNVVTIYENDAVATAAKIIEEKQIRRLVVLKQDGTIADVISLCDIATRCNNNNLSAEIIYAVSEKQK